MGSVLLYILGVLVVFVGIAVSIALHEIGHLVPAKKFGVRVGQYMIGFGPTVFSRRRGETEYGIKAIPLGGYISMAGMYPPKRGDDVGRTASTGFFNTMVQDARTGDRDSVRDDEEHRTFYQLAWWKRIVIMLGGPFMNLVIGAVCATIVLCGFGISQPTTTVGTVYKCVSESAAAKSCDGKPDAPANAAGLKPSDEIVSVGGTAVSTWDAAQKQIRSSTGTIELVVRRDGTTVDLSVTPVQNTIQVTDETGQVVKDSAGKVVTETVPFIGMAPAYATVQQPVTAVPGYLWSNITSVGNIILHFPQRIVAVAQAAFGGGERDANGPISVVGVGRIAGEVVSIDTAPVGARIATLVSIIGSVNVALFVFNLIPLLPLDGGHVLGAVWEAVRRRFAAWFHRPDPGPVDIAKLIPLTMAIVVILGATSALLIYADIVNPVKLF